MIGYVGLILRSTAVATASRSTFEGTMRVLWRYCDKREATAHAEYPQQYSDLL